MPTKPQFITLVLTPVEAARLLGCAQIDADAHDTPDAVDSKAEFDAIGSNLRKLTEAVKPGAPNMVAALSQVSFYARVNHGTKSRDYGEVVDPVLRGLGLPTGVLS